MGKKAVLSFVGIFLLGMVAGSGLGVLIGRSSLDVQREARIAKLEAQVATATENYALMVREYNSLYGLKAGSLVIAPVAQGAAAPVSAVAPAAAEPVTPVPAQGEPAAAQTPEVAAETTEAATDAAAPGIVADFKAMALNGTGDLEGPPPQPFRFTDLSTGEITSWKWEFGDGEISEEQNPEHTIKACPMDLCTVTLTVCGPAGCDTETKEEYLWVSEQCTGC
mgnify:CR=1 FL=1